MMDMPFKQWEIEAVGFISDVHESGFWGLAHAKNKKTGEEDTLLIAHMQVGRTVYCMPVAKLIEYSEEYYAIEGMTHADNAEYESAPVTSPVPDVFRAAFAEED